MERRPLNRAIALAMGLGAIVSTVGAEEYEAVIYGNPVGTTQLIPMGAGDNGMMTGYANVMTGRTHAAYMTPTGFRDLHPSSLKDSYISDSWGATYHAGYGITSDNKMRALYWIGGGEAVNLQPADPVFTESEAKGGGGQLQVGWARGFFFCNVCGKMAGAHGARWSRTSSSFSQLHHKTADWIIATSTDGVDVGGWGGTISTTYHALFWKAGATVAKDLHPPAYMRSHIFGVWNGQQVGTVDGDITLAESHAALWSGTPESFVDLHPAPFRNSQAVSVRNGVQVGHGEVAVGGRHQALAWHGAAGTWTNLHARLQYPYNLLWNSWATDIDGQGNIVGYIANHNGSVHRPVIWKRID